MLCSPACPRGGPSWGSPWLWVWRAWASVYSLALSLSGSRFMDTSALIRLPDDCTMGYIIECKLGGRLQPSPLFHSHLETLQLLRTAQLPEQVSWPWSRWQRGRGNQRNMRSPQPSLLVCERNLELQIMGLGSSLLMGKLRPRMAKDPLRVHRDSTPSLLTLKD